MKMLKKMAALLLAGVMAMALLTACGDEAPSKTVAQQAEEKVFAVMSEATGIQVNDADLKALADKTFDSLKDGKVNRKAVNSLSKIADGDSEDQYRVIAAAPIPDMKVNDFTNDSSETYTLLAVTPENLNNMDVSAITAMVKNMSKAGIKFEKMGVTAKTVDGKTYIAVGMQYQASTRAAQ